MEATRYGRNAAQDETFNWMAPPQYSRNICNNLDMALLYYIIFYSKKLISCCQTKKIFSFLCQFELIGFYLIVYQEGRSRVVFI